MLPPQNPPANHKPSGRSHGKSFDEGTDHRASEDGFTPFQGLLQFWTWLRRPRKITETDKLEIERMMIQADGRDPGWNYTEGFLARR